MTPKNIWNPILLVVSNAQSHLYLHVPSTVPHAKFQPEKTLRIMHH